MKWPLNLSKQVKLTRRLKHYFPMSILEEILAHKSQEVQEQRKVSESSLAESLYFDRTIVSMKAHLQRHDKVGIISEIKRSSPSEGLINGGIDVKQLSTGYVDAGATGLSVLSDYKYFGGTLEDVVTARKFSTIVLYSERVYCG